MTARGDDEREETERLLGELLEAAHAAVYAYGVVGARLSDGERTAAQAAAGAHRGWRDRLAAALRDAGAQPPAAQPAYEVSVAGRDDALAVAVRVEEGLSVRFRDLVGGTDDEAVRRLGVDGLVETAVRAASWRLALGRLPPTVALPGSA